MPAGGRPGPLPWLRAKEAALRKAGQENDEAALESKAETIAFEKRAGLRADKIARELEDAKLPPVVIRNGSGCPPSISIRWCA